MDQRPSRKDEPHAQGSTVRSFHYETHDQLREHLAAFVGAYNFAKRLKALAGLAPFPGHLQSLDKKLTRFSLPPDHITSG